MSIAIIDMTGDRRQQVLDHNLAEYSAQPEQQKVPFVNSLLTFMLLLSVDGAVSMPEDIEDHVATVLKLGLADKDLGRVGVRQITSPWVKEKFPISDLEVVVTLPVSENITHTLLVYL